MRYQVLQQGVFIDYKCTSIVPIQGGIVIPVSANNHITEHEYQKDLHAFLTKWFSTVTKDLVADKSTPREKAS